MKVIYTALFLFVATLGFSQDITNVEELQPTEAYDNIHIKKLEQ